jgi:NAD(P)-dependent dehydrogenase (short-subunit alcohol dehydrogenase family)
VTYGRETTDDEVLASADLTGKVAVVTGASSGLGREVVRTLFAHGVDVISAVRNPSTSPTGKNVQLDLASLDSVRAAAAETLALVTRIDMLFNNAGLMATAEGRTADGFELQLGTNYLGHFLLTALLAGAISPNGRIINTSSLGHMITGVDWADPHFRTRSYDKWQAYGQSKSANILFTRGLAKHGYVAYAVHPGAIDTGLTRHLEGEELSLVESASSAELKSVEQGAATLVWAATAEGLASGAYLADCAVADAAPHAVDSADVDRLWSWSEEQVREQFPSR